MKSFKEKKRLRKKRWPRFKRGTTPREEEREES